MEMLIGGPTRRISHRPDLASDRFWLVLDSFGPVLDEFGLERSSLRAKLVVFCTKMDVCSQKMVVFCTKMDQARNRETSKKSKDHPRYTHPSRRSAWLAQLAPIGARQGWEHQVLRQVIATRPYRGPQGMGTQVLVKAATCPYRGPQGWAQVLVNYPP